MHTRLDSNRETKIVRESLAYQSHHFSDFIGILIRHVKEIWVGALVTDFTTMRSDIEVLTFEAVPVQISHNHFDDVGFTSVM